MLLLGCQSIGRLTQRGPSPEGASPVHGSLLHWGASALVRPAPGAGWWTVRRDAAIVRGGPRTFDSFAAVERVLANLPRPGRRYLIDASVATRTRHGPTAIIIAPPRWRPTLLSLGMARRMSASSGDSHSRLRLRLL